MTRLLTPAPAAIAGAALALAALAAAAPSGTALDCTAAGYDIQLSNPGPETVEPGQAVAWDVPFVRKSGVLEVDTTLAPGESVFVSGGLGSDYLSTPKPCTAVVR